MSIRGKSTFVYLRGPRKSHTVLLSTGLQRTTEMGVTTRQTATHLSVDSKNAGTVFSNQDAPVCGISARRRGLGQDLRAQGGKQQDKNIFPACPASPLVPLDPKPKALHRLSYPLNGPEFLSQQLQPKAPESHTPYISQSPSGCQVCRTPSSSQGRRSLPQSWTSGDVS